MYARFFAPQNESAPSGFQDTPRPFVIRAAALDGREFAAGQIFHFDVHSFDLEESGLAYFVLSFVQLARDGLGPGRGRTELVRVDQLDGLGRPAARLFDGRSMRIAKPGAPLSIGLRPLDLNVRRVRVRFRTPTELKSGEGLAERPEFGVLFSRIRDRVNALATFYGDGRLELDFRGLGERAAAVRMVRCEVRRVEVARVSGRTGQRHSLGGFVGVAEYEGEMAEFLPFLEVAYPDQEGLKRTRRSSKTGEPRLLNKLGGRRVEPRLLQSGSKAGLRLADRAGVESDRSLSRCNSIAATMPDSFGRTKRNRAISSTFLHHLAGI